MHAEEARNDALKARRRTTEASQQGKPNGTRVWALEPRTIAATNGVSMQVIGDTRQPAAYNTQSRGHYFNPSSTARAEQQLHQGVTIEETRRNAEAVWQKREEFEGLWAEVVKSPTTAITEGDSVQTVDEWRELASQSARFRNEATGKSKAARARRDKDGARLVSMQSSIFDQCVLRCDYA